MSTAGQTIQFSSLGTGQVYSFGGDRVFIPPIGSSNNSWGPRWRWYILSPCFYTTAYATYRWLNQPKIEVAYSYADPATMTWNQVAWRTIEGNTSKREAIFGHNIEVGQQHNSATSGGSSTVYFDWNHSNHHLWCIYARKYRNKDYGWGYFRVQDAGTMGESRYNSQLKGHLIKASPKTSLSYSTTQDSSSFVIKTVETELSVAQAMSIFNPDLARGSPVLAGQDWRLVQGIE